MDTSTTLTTIEMIIVTINYLTIESTVNSKESKISKLDNV